MHINMMMYTYPQQRMPCRLVGGRGGGSSQDSRLMCKGSARCFSLDLDPSTSAVKEKKIYHLIHICDTYFNDSAALSPM